MNGKLSYTICYKGFGPTPPATAQANPALPRRLFHVELLTYPGALDALDDVARRNIAVVDAIDAGNVVLTARDTGPPVIVNLLRKHHPGFESEVDAAGGIAFAWFSFSRPFKLEDFLI